MDGIGGFGHQITGGKYKNMKVGTVPEGVVSGFKNTKDFVNQRDRMNAWNELSPESKQVFDYIDHSQKRKDERRGQGIMPAPIDGKGVIEDMQEYQKLSPEQKAALEEFNRQKGENLPKSFDPNNPIPEPMDGKNILDRMRREREMSPESKRILDEMQGFDRAETKYNIKNMEPRPYMGRQLISGGEKIGNNMQNFLR